MKKILALFFSFVGLSGFAQTNPGQLAPGAMGQLNTLLNNPAMVQPTVAVPMGKNWFRLETDAHVFTDEVNLNQVTAVLLDLGNEAKIFDGKKSKLTGNIVSRRTDETVVDFVMISFAPMGIQIKTPYRASVKAVEKTVSKTYVEIRQLASDSDSNKDVKDLFAARYAEEVTVAGKKYVYIRIYAVDDINASILPGAKGVLEKNSGPTNIEALQLIVAAAKAL